MITLHAAANLLGVPDRIAYRLAALGWLPSRRTFRRGHRLLASAAVARFVATPRAWLVVAPDDVPCPELRAIAQAARAATPGAWWSTAALAAHYVVHPTLVGRWRRAGWPAGATWETWAGAYLWEETPPPPPATRWGNQHGRGLS